MCDAQQNAAVPENADKALFAEDIVNYILYLFELPLLSSGIANHRALVYNAFNSDVKAAAYCIVQRRKKEFRIEYEEVAMEKKMNLKLFLKRVKRSKLSPIELVPIRARVHSFLLCSLDISMMAAHFYMRGLTDAPRLAVDSIIDMIKDVDMVEEGAWEALTLTAVDVTRFQTQIGRNHVTPPGTGSSSPYSSSSRESFMPSPDYTTNIVDLTRDHPTPLLSGLASTASSSTESSRSPDHENDVEDGQDHENDVEDGQDHENDVEDGQDHENGVEDGQEEHAAEKPSDRHTCRTCAAAARSSTEEPVPSSSTCRHYRKTVGEKSGNIGTFSDNPSCSTSYSVSQAKSSDSSSHSFEETSSEDDTPKLKMRKRPKKKPSYSWSTNSDSDSDKRKQLKKLEDEWDDWRANNP